MVAKVRTVAFHGVEVIEVETQVTIASGLPAFTVVGLPDKAVAESRERVRAALASLGLGLPPRRITVNLPRLTCSRRAAISTCRSRWRLLAAMEALPADELGGYMALGEVALDGATPPQAGYHPTTRAGMVGRYGSIPTVNKSLFGDERDGASTRILTQVS